MATDLKIYTDGSCLKNPGGPTGWAAILTYKGHEQVLTGGQEVGTNNVGELMAAIVGLEALIKPMSGTVYTDSQYVIKGITEWLPGWKRKGWKTSTGDPVKNKELWQRLDEAAQGHKLAWVWVKGHNGHEYNERCDQLAQAAAHAHATAGVL